VFVLFFIVLLLSVEIAKASNFLIFVDNNNRLM